MSKNEEVMLCGHCGKTAVFYVRAQNDAKPDFSDDYVGQEITVFRVLICSSCDEPTLEQSRVEYRFERDIDGSALTTPIAAERKIIYPEAKPVKLLTDIPKIIEKEYEATLKV